jgi:hypothetical protein
MRASSVEGAVQQQDEADALLCKAPPGEQSQLVDADPERYFVPPYVGPKGWVGLRAGCLRAVGRVEMVCLPNRGKIPALRAAADPERSADASEG